MRKPPEELLAQNHQGAISPSEDWDFNDWQLRWSKDQIAREEALKEQKDPKQPHQPDVLEMGEDTPLLCCPEDHRCKGSCKADRTLCRFCELPVCSECQIALAKKQLSPMALLNESLSSPRPFSIM